MDYLILNLKKWIIHFYIQNCRHAIIHWELKPRLKANRTENQKFNDELSEEDKVPKKVKISLKLW